jgi:HD-like signal output (HDOD) protein
MSPEINATTAPEQDAARVGVLLSNAIRDIGIPPCPAILERINSEMSKDEPDFNQLDRIICSDVSLAAGLIAIANSPFFGLQNRVRSVNEALHMLGLGVSSRAIAGIMLRKLFPLTPSLERFWHATATIARLGGWLAKRFHNGIKVRPDDAYTFSLFRDCGIPILMRRFDQYREVLKAANEETALSFVAVEQAAFPTNHAAVGCLLAQSWWLPDEISLAIRYHHDQETLEQGSDSKLLAAALGLIATAQLAEHLFQYHTGLSQGQEWNKLGASCLRLLNLDEEGLAEIYKESALIVTSEV